MVFVRKGSDYSPPVGGSAAGSGAAAAAAASEKNPKHKGIASFFKPAAAAAPAPNAKAKTAAKSAAVALTVVGGTAVDPAPALKVLGVKSGILPATAAAAQHDLWYAPAPSLPGTRHSLNLGQLSCIECDFYGTHDQTTSQ
jgi:hypothetical protein